MKKNIIFCGVLFRRLKVFTIVSCLILCIMVSPVPASAASSSSETTSSTSVLPANKTYKILLVGNSLTEYGDNSQYVDYLKKFLKAGGYKYSITVMAHNNLTLEKWSNTNCSYGKSLYKLMSKNSYDILVLQQHTSYSIKGKGNDSCLTIVNWARKKNSKVKVILRSTWAYDRNVTLSGVRYTYAAQQVRMDSNYARMAKSVKAWRISYEGDSFQKLKSKYAFWRKDKNHPTATGNYLAACTLYSTITGRSPVGLYHGSGLSDTKAKELQTAAWTVYKQHYQ